jgi:glycosyltransferase involved in cell wall biosynthesis
MSQPGPILLNALPVGSGGNATLARELSRGFSRDAGRQVVLLLADGRPLHDEIAADVADVAKVERAPAALASRWRRSGWQRRELPRICRNRGVAGVLQLNGMVQPGLDVPQLCHFGDPWPYLREAWVHWKNPILAALRRRAHRRTLAVALHDRRVGISFTSHFLRDLILDHHNLRPPDPRVHHNGVPPDWADRAASDTRDGPAREDFILTVGNVSPYKRQMQVVEALPLVQQQLEQRVTYRIVGYCDPVYQSELQTKIRELHLEDQVSMEGRVSQERLEQLYATAGVMCLTSVCESFGIPIVEAQSVGLPVVASDAAALPEVAGDGAEIASGDSPATTAAAIVRVLSDAEHAARLVAKGRRNVARFRWDETARAMVDHLDTLARS